MSGEKKTAGAGRLAAVKVSSGKDGCGRSENGSTPVCVKVTVRTTARGRFVIAGRATA